MNFNLVLGGGHGTQALHLLPDQKIYLGTWDDGGSTGLLRAIYPQVLPFGDLRAVLSGKLVRNEQQELARLLMMRSANIAELLVGGKQLEVLTKVQLEGFGGFLESFYEEKLKYLLNNHTHDVPEDNLGNLLFLYLYLKTGIKGIKQWLQSATNTTLDFDFVYSEPVFLYGYYFDQSTKRLKILDSEKLIDRWHKPVIRFSVRDATAEHPSLNPQLLLDARDAIYIFLAPGSPENYLPALDDELIKQSNKTNKKIILIAQLFLSAKDQKLKEQIEYLAKNLHNFEVWLPSIDSIKAILDDTNLLLSYAIQGKFLDVFFLSEYREVLNDFLEKWKNLSEKNELYDLLYKVYTERANGIQEYNGWIIRPCMHVIQEKDGWKHDPLSIEAAYTKLRLSELD